MAQRILVVDDDRDIVRLVRTYLERSGYTVLVAHNGVQALQLLRSERPDLVVLDLMLPGSDGWAITRQVRGDPQLATTPIIMMTARVEDHDKILGLQLGADDYVPKPFNPSEVVARVRAVLRRVQGEAAPRSILQAGPLSIDLDGHQVQVDGQRVHVTPTEFFLLSTLAQSVDRAMTRAQLIEKGLGYAYEGMERTVDSHIKGLRHHLDQAGGEGFGTAVVQTVFGVGYRLCSEPEWSPVEAR